MKKETIIKTPLEETRIEDIGDTMRRTLKVGTYYGSPPISYNPMSSIKYDPLQTLVIEKTFLREDEKFESILEELKSL